MLIVDDFGVEYVGEQHAHHLGNVLKEHHKSSRTGKVKHLRVSTCNGIMQRNTVTELVACL